MYDINNEDQDDTPERVRPAGLRKMLCRDMPGKNDIPSYDHFGSGSEINTT